MIARRWVSIVALAVFAGIAVGFVSAARADGESKSTSGANSSEKGKKTAKPKKRRKPVHEGDTNENGVIYTR